MANPRIYGYLILAAMAFGNSLSSIYYWKAGREYEKIMEAKENSDQG